MLIDGAPIDEPYGNEHREMTMAEGIENSQAILALKNSGLSRIDSRKKRFTAPEIPGRLPLSDIGSMMESN